MLFIKNVLFRPRVLKLMISYPAYDILRLAAWQSGPDSSQNLMVSRSLYWVTDICSMIADIPFYGILIHHKWLHFEWPSILNDQTFLRKNNPTYCNMFMSSRDWRTETGWIWNASWTQIVHISTFQWAYITQSTCQRSSIPVLIFIFVCSDSCTLNFK